MKKHRILAGLAAGVVAASMFAAVPASADTVYTVIEGTKITKFDKYLVMESDAVVPSANFSFSIAPGEAVDGTFPVFAGVGEPKFLLANVTEGMTEGDEKTLKTNDNVGTDSLATVRFSSGDTDDDKVTISEVQKGEGRTVKFKTPSDDSDEKYAQKHIAVDFSGVAFPEPGVYRYIITESASDENQASGVINDPDNTRVLDVVVVDASSEGTSKLSINSYILHDTVNDVPVNKTGGPEMQNKSTGFTNSYTTYDLQFSKAVRGNQASRDKYFKFDITISGAKGAEVTIDGSKIDVAPSKSINTSHEEADMKAANTKDDNTDRNGQQLTADASGNITASFYIRHGQSVKILGIPAGAKYTVAEDQEDYTASVTATEAKNGDVAVNNAKNGITDLNTGIGGDTTAVFTNEKTGSIPTGVITTVALSAGIVILGAAGVIGGLYIKKKKSESEED